MPKPLRLTHKPYRLRQSGAFSLVLTVPPQVAMHYNFRAGDPLWFYDEGGKLVLTRAKELAPQR